MSFSAPSGKVSKSFKQSISCCFTCSMFYWVYVSYSTGYWGDSCSLRKDGSPGPF